MSASGSDLLVLATRVQGSHHNLEAVAEQETLLLDSTGAGVLSCAAAATDFTGPFAARKSSDCPRPRAHTTCVALRLALLVGLAVLPTRWGA